MEKFDEYKFFVEQTQRLSERRQASTQTYLAVNTAILAILALLVKDTVLNGWQLAAATAPLFLVGILACGIWYRIINQYRELIGWRYKQLIAMEKGLRACHQMFMREEKKYFKSENGKKRFGFSRLEVGLPRLFTALYIAFVGLILVCAIFKIDVLSPQ